MPIFDSTKRYIFNEKLKFIDNTNYLDTFLDIHIESFPIVTRYIQYKIYYKLSIYIEKYSLWEYKLYIIDNILYIDIPIENIFKLHIKIKKKLTYYCKKCLSRKSILLASIFKYQNKNIKLKRIFCTNCLTRQTCIKKYGTPYAAASKVIQEKIKQTCIQKYGVDNATKTEEVREKMQNTMIERYGKPFAAQTERFKEKMKNTCIEKYNVSCALLDENVKEKRKQTMVERYGVESPQQSPEIRKKTAKTMFENNSAPTSKAQKHIFEVLKNNDEDIALNYRFSTLLLDIAFINAAIFCEYDGSGHDLNVRIGKITKEEFIKKERNRSSMIRNAGWKEMRIISNNDKLPNDNVLLKMIYLAKEYLLNTNHSWIYIDLNEQCFIFTKEHIKISFDSLKTIL